MAMKLSILIDGNSSGLTDAAETAEQSIKDLSDTTKDVTKGLKSMGDAGVRASKKMDSATESVEQQMRALEEKIRDTNESLDRMKPLAEKAGDSLRRAANEGRTGFKRTENQIDETNDSLAAMHPMLLSIAGAMGGAFSVYELSQFADTATSVRNRIRDVTESTEEYNEVMQLVRDTALDSSASLESTAQLYSRLKRATGDLVDDNVELASIVETINKSFALSGATFDEANNAIIQLSQGLNAGVLRGDEFNSVAEQAPEILKAVAIQTGKTTAEIREMAAEGRITADLLIRSLQNYADTVDKRFSETERTIAQHFTNSKTNFLAYISDIDEANSISETFGEGVENLSTNLDALSDTLLALSVIGTSRYVPALYSAIAAKVALTRAALTATPAVTGMSAALGVATTRLTATTVATNALALSQRGLALAMGFLTGPAGLLLLAGGALTYYAMSANDAQYSSVGLKNEIKKLAEEYAKLDQSARNIQLTETIDKEAKAKQRLLEIQTQLKKKQEELNAIPVNPTQGAGSLYAKGDIERAPILSEVTELKRAAAEAETIYKDLSATREKYESINTAKTQEEDTVSKAAKKAEERLKKMLQSYQDETDMLDAELQIQEQVRAGYMSEEEGQIYSNFYRREQQAKAHYKSLKDEIATHYKDEIDAAAGNADRIIELEQQKKTRLEELEQIHNENMRLMGEDQRLQLEEANKGFFDRMIDMINVSAQDFDTIWGNTFDRFAQGIGDATASAIMEQQSFGDAMKTIAKAALSEVISGIVQIGVKYLVLKALQAKADAATAAVSSTSATAAATAATTAWATPAALASLASFGANAGPAMAGIGATVGMAQGLSIAGIAHDGLDRVPAANEGTYLVRRDEMVLNPKQRENFDAMRQSFEEGKGGGKPVILNSSPTINVDARGSTMSESQVEAKVRMALDEYDSMLINDFAGNGERSQLLRVG